jgi:hypothetical protein
MLSYRAYGQHLIGKYATAALLCANLWIRNAADRAKVLTQIKSPDGRADTDIAHCTCTLSPLREDNRYDNAVRGASCLANVKR